MAPTTVRMVLVAGENGDGVTVDEENFAITNSEDAPTLSAPDQVVAAILGTREGANEAGYQLLSTGVTWSDQQEAADLRDALAARKVENVMLVSAFLAAAALAQSMGCATGYARTALLYIEPDSATLAVVDATDGSIADVRREPLPDDDDQAVARLVGLVSAAEELEDHPEGLLVVGSGVDVPLITPALEAATSLPLSVPERPDMALARGAALASANAPLFASSTAALAYALDPGTGSVSQHALAPGYLSVAEAAAGAEGAEALAYSAVTDDSAAVYTQGGPDAYADDDEEEDFTTGMYPDFGAAAFGQPSRTPFLAALSVIMIFVVGVMALVISLAFSIRPSVSSRPSLAQNVVAPRQVPAPAPKALVPAPPAPAPIPAPAPAAAPAPAPAPARVPGPAPVPAPLPVLVPAPAPVAPPPIIPPLIPRIFGPPLSPWGGGGGDHDGGGWGHGFGGGHGGFGGGFGGHGRG
jgi:uncharacterized membrane protein YgcG